MKREPGYYWIRHKKGSPWEAVHTDGDAWDYRGDRLDESELALVSEPRIATPDEMPTTVPVPVGAWSQALNASEATKVGDTVSTDIALRKMRRLMDEYQQHSNGA